MAETTKVTFKNGKCYEQPTGLFINNKFVKAKLGKTTEVINPSTEEVIVEIEQAGKEDVDIAVDAAEKAFHKWRDVDPLEKGQLLYKLATLIEEDRKTIESIESLNNGKSLADAASDLDIVITYFKSCAGYADKVDGRVPEAGKDHLTYIKREPLGVCGQIIPWNFPIMMWAWKIAPAIVTGNTVVLKPASVTPLTALYTSQLIVKAGIPPGVVNIVPGPGSKCGDAILKHPKIRKIAFTGSTEVGRTVMTEAAQSNLKKVTLELGGKSANIVLNDADIAKTIPNLIKGIYFNGGEVCSAGSRIYVQDEIYDKLIPEFVKAAKNLKVGDPFDEGVFQGAQTLKSQFESVLNYIDIGKKEGAELLTGGERIGNKGFFIQPTIFANVKEDMKIVKEEIFGPVVTVSRFSTADQVLKWANDSEYGLGAGIHTENISNAIYFADRLESGTVWINTYNDFHALVPFGGYKQSGMGREMGEEALSNYTQYKSVRIKL